MAGGPSSVLTRRLADDREKRERPDIGLVRGGAGGGALPRLDRRTEADPRLRGVAAEIHAARTPKHLVEDQQGEGGTAHRERADDAGWAQGDREREAERAVGERLPFGEGFRHTGRFSGRDGEEQEGEDLLRNAEQRQPVRDTRQDSDREEGGDPRPTDRAIHRDAGEARKDPSMSGQHHPAPRAS